MRREKKALPAAERANISQVRCRCEASDELQRRNEEREQLLTANRQLATALNAAKSELVAAKKKCARADILFMQYHVEQTRAKELHDEPPARQDASVQCDLAAKGPKLARTVLSPQGIARHTQASSHKSAPLPQPFRRGRTFSTQRATQKPSATATTPLDLVVTKSALRQHKPVVYTEPRGNVKLRQSVPLIPSAINSVQQTPPRKRTFEGKENQPPKALPTTSHRLNGQDNELSVELASLLNACDSDEGSPMPCFAKRYNMEQPNESLHPPPMDLSTGTEFESASKKHRVTRRGTSIPEYKEVSLNRKMRQGDRYTFHTYFK